MKKFVSMAEINRVFDDMESVDYLTVSEVTDSYVCLQVHLRRLTVPKKGSKAWIDLNDRCLVLGKILDRRIDFVLVRASLTKLFFDTLFWPFRRLT